MTERFSGLSWPSRSVAERLEMRAAEVAHILRTSRSFEEAYRKGLE